MATNIRQAARRRTGRARLGCVLARLAVGATAAAAIGGAAQASTEFYLDLTQTATGLKVSSNLPTQGGFDPNAFVPNAIPEPDEQQYFFGSTYGGYDRFHVYDDDVNTGFQIGAVAWRDPTRPLYNVLLFLPSGNRGNEDFDLVTNVPNLGSVPLVYDSQDVSGHTCYVPGAYLPCPVLGNGQARDMSIYIPDYPAAPVDTFSTLHVTYHDAVGAVPEPAAWSLTIAGFGLAGATLRRRRIAAA